MAEFRLLADCFFDNRHHKSGEIVERPDDWKGPSKTAPAVDGDGHVVFKNGLKVFRDIPLYEKIEEKEKA